MLLRSPLPKIVSKTRRSERKRRAALRLRRRAAVRSKGGTAVPPTPSPPPPPPPSLAGPLVCFLFVPFPFFLLPPPASSGKASRSTEAISALLLLTIIAAAGPETSAAANISSGGVGASNGKPSRIRKDSTRVALAKIAANTSASEGMRIVTFSSPRGDERGGSGGVQSPARKRPGAGKKVPLPLTAREAFSFVPPNASPSASSRFRSLSTASACCLRRGARNV